MEQVTLRYLATGISYTSLHYDWRISVAALSKIIPETCEAIIRRLRCAWLTTPKTAEEWRDVSRTLEPWNYPNCLGLYYPLIIVSSCCRDIKHNVSYFFMLWFIGCIDGKHIAMNKPYHAGSQYHNYKGFESLILLAVCDGNYRYENLS